VLIVGNALAALALLAVGALIWLESSWAKPDTSRDPEAAFLHGTIGTELMPLPVAIALPVLFQEHFVADGARGDWIEQFGFIRSDGSEPKQTLPLGFVATRYLYDPLDVGFISPDKPDSKRYFRFDTAQRGNSNCGHDYPWAYGDPQRNTADPEALLDYLKTL
jgi:hypothetical protein